MALHFWEGKKLSGIIISFQLRPGGGGHQRFGRQAWATYSIINARMQCATGVPLDKVSQDFDRPGWLTVLVVSGWVHRRGFWAERFLEARTASLSVAAAEMTGSVVVSGLDHAHVRDLITNLIEFSALIDHLIPKPVMTSNAVSSCLGVLDEKAGWLPFSSSFFMLYTLSCRKGF